jgi:lipoate-protein ligase A
MKWRIIELQGIDLYALHAVEDALYEHPGKDNVMLFSKVNKPGISLASTQNYSLDIDDKLCQKDNVSVTRRMTGGRSMYIDENYFLISIFARDHDFHAVDKQYEKTIGMITNALRGVTGKEYVLKHKNDILVEGRKIGGAAQRNSPSMNMVHCYVRVDNDLHKMLHYLKIDGHKIDRYYDELRPYIASIKDFHDTTNFYEKFVDSMLEGLDYTLSELTNSEMLLIQRRIPQYRDQKYILGRDDYPSKGNCDIIEGSGKDAKLKIPSLEGKVRFS